MTRILAKKIGRVVGLDVSEAMLAKAKALTRSDNLTYKTGDFRNFSLGESFDAVTCRSNSLNYVNAPVELEDVFRCVYHHLQPGGLFIFDVLDETRFRQLADKKVIASVGERVFEIYFFYDPKNRISESRVVIEKVVERHRRVPIETQDVRRAASKVGLMVADKFGYSWRYYVLRKPI
ncbi:Methyltransferase [Fimbriiglobus ruber]|uniref:Methyltransferase n=1 Tax=Fimbriiglobus ruber TaxID=1908690 RepID=A0A225DK38_9BACT|nr:Methyltransferase [Fimbriiglobus ruber]